MNFSQATWNSCLEIPEVCKWYTPSLLLVTHSVELVHFEQIADLKKLCPVSAALVSPSVQLDLLLSVHEHAAYIKMDTRMQVFVLTVRALLCQPLLLFLSFFLFSNFLCFLELHSKPLKYSLKVNSIGLF